MEIKFTKPPFLLKKEILQFIMRTFIFLFCTTVFSFSPGAIFSQNTKITIGADKIVTIDEIFELISKQSEYVFVYQADLFKNTPKVRLKKGIIKANKLLAESLFGNDFSFEVIENNTIIIRQKAVDEVPQDPIRVTGKVTDEDGTPLPGVTVRISGTNNGTATNFDGDYTLVVPSNTTVLVFTSIGFATKEIVVDDQTTIDVTMQEAVNELDEVILNAGYYNVKKREATGSIAKVEAKTIAQQPVTNPLAALQGRMAGINIVQTGGVPGSPIEVQIRGRNSIRPDGNQPLYLVDGMPFSSESVGSSFVSGQTLPISVSENGVSALNSINPSDIESIEVLKDADATAIYGSRGANGVVLITTKKGKAGKTQLDVNLYSGMSTVTRNLDVLNTEQYLEMRREAFVNDGVTDLTTLPSFRTNDLLVWDQNRFTDWQKELIGGTAYTTNIQTSVSGGSANTQFLLSGGYHRETTVFPGGFDYGKISGHTRLNHRSNNDKFKLSFSASYVDDKNNLLREELTRNANFLAPNAPALRDEEGNLNFENSTFNTNPLTKLEGEYLAKSRNLIANALLEYELARGLTFRTNLGFNTIRIKESITNPSTRLNPELLLRFGLGSKELSFFTSNNTSRESWIVEPQIDWNIAFGKGKISLLAGATFQEQTSDRFVAQGIGFPDNSLITNLAAAITLRILESGDTEYRYNAFFGRINYNWDGKYILNLTGRRDGSSRFGPGKQFANFGAVGAAWLFSNEEFLRDGAFLSYGKLRGSYGTTGSDQFPDYQFLDTYSLGNTDYEGTIGLRPTQLFNPNLAWEINKKLEFALELGFWKDRILLNAAYYRNRSSNQLIGIPLSDLTGFPSIQGNLDATVENTGLELELNTVNFRKGEFHWQTGFNITIPKNELIAFPDLEGSTFANQLVIGEPLNILKLYESTGVNPQTGIYGFTDFNGDEAISAVDDRQLIQSLDPEFYGGLNNSFSYKGLELDVFFQFVKQTGPNYLSFGILPGTANNMSSALFEDRWQALGDVASFQRFSTGLDRDALIASNNNNLSDAAYTDASFVRLKNISLSYQLSEKWIKGFKARIYMQGQNLWTITDYFGLDPENQSLTNLPLLKTFTLGAQFTF